LREYKSIFHYLLLFQPPHQFLHTSSIFWSQWYPHYSFTKWLMHIPKFLSSSHQTPIFNSLSPSLSVGVK
jgi:hypothetical protein